MTQEIIMIISGIIIAIISGTFMAVMKRSWVKKANEDKKIDELEKSVHILQKSIWRLNKTVLIMAKILDEQTAKEHPDLTNNLENIASELLNESDNS
jgi:peptidoglycan hydrolase CwlO-like protein